MTTSSSITTTIIFFIIKLIGTVLLFQVAYSLLLCHYDECYCAECCWVFVPNWLLKIHFSFTKSIEMTEFINLFNFPNLTSTSIWRHLCITSNQIIQIIEFLNFKSPNFFNFSIGIETNSAFLINVKLGY